MKMQVLGARGSVVACGEQFNIYGSDTSAYLIMDDDDAIFLDSGTGITHAPDTGDREISIILSHFHLDHVIGITFFPMMKQKKVINIYADMTEEEFNSLSDRLFAPPFWPCGLNDYPCTIKFHTLQGELRIGNFTISSIAGNHPNGVRVIKVEKDNKSIVYATDYESCEETDDKLIEFADNAEIMIFDGQYTQEEYISHKGYGHSTKEKGIELIKNTNIKKIMFTHFDPEHNDDFLKKEEDRISKLCDKAVFAKQGDIVEI